MQSQLGTRHLVTGNLALFIGICVWATHFPVTEQLLRSWDVYSITTARLLSASATLSIAWLLLEKNNPRGLVPWRRIALLGCGGITFATLFLVAGVRYAGAVNAGIVAACGPLVGALLGWLINNERLRSQTFAGMALAVGGSALAVIAGGVAIESGTAGVGELLILLGSVCFVLYSIGVQRWGRHLSVLAMSALTMATGGLGCLAVVASLSASGTIVTRFNLDGQSLLLLGYMAVGPASLSLFLWHSGVRRLGVTVATMYSNLAPVVVVIVAIVMGRVPSWMHFLGGALIIAGVMVAQLPQFRAEHRHKSA
jgi:drug/metabolite transporter (DMT)-like permease